jgi:hypothetical protein
VQEGVLYSDEILGRTGMGKLLDGNADPFGMKG